MTPARHSELSVARRGGAPDDYHPIHEFLDSTKALCADGRHRILHTHWGVDRLVVPIFGRSLVNADGRRVMVRELCERDHLLPDYGNRFIPTLGDFVAAMADPPGTAWRDAIEAFHARHAVDARTAALLLSPLGVTGRLRSLLLTHNSWFANLVLPRLSGAPATLEDFALTPDRVFGSMRFEPWMDNGRAPPPSAAGLGAASAFAVAGDAP